jgi:hypothetical protein
MRCLHFFEFLKLCRKAVGEPLPEQKLGRLSLIEVSLCLINRLLASPKFIRTCSFEGTVFSQGLASGLFDGI